MLLFFLIAHHGHVVGAGSYCHWSALPRHCFSLFAAPQSVTCHVVSVFTFCPSCVCRDLEGKKGVCVFVRGGCDGRLRQNVCSLSPRDKWAPPRPMYPDIPDVPRPHAATDADRPKRRRVTVWLITTHCACCVAAGGTPLNHGPTVWITSLFYKEKYWLSKKWICTGGMGRWGMKKIENYANHYLRNKDCLLRSNFTFNPS